MPWNMVPTTAGRAGNRPVRLFLFLLSLECTLLPAGATPFVEMKFHNNSAQSLANTGSAGTSASFGAPNPTYSTNTPFGGGAYAIDIAPATGGAYAVDLLTGEVLNAAKDLKSFTIMGWLNCRSGTVSPGGNRIVSWYQNINSADGVDLAMTSTGALSLGIRSWNDASGTAASNSGNITVDGAAGYNNWRFFAVTYDETLSSGHVKFYFGTSTSPAVLDRTVNYDRGSTGLNIAPSLTLGNHSTAARTGSVHAAFRGLMDEIRIFGSKTNGDGALSLSAILNLQGAAPLAGQPGLLYERWNGITGTAISQLTSNSRYPASPDQTLVRPTSEGFLNIADNYGVRLSGWIEAPETGNYVFGLTTDDAGELRLSTDASPGNKQLIASQATWAPYAGWAVQSAAIPLEAGTFYYIEALMTEGGGGDHIKVGWRRPSDTDIGIIVAPAMHVTPPITDVLYPSAYHLYEQGTGTRKATMGWEKDGGNSHFYIEAEGHRSMTVQDGSVIVPDRLTFGGKFPTDPNVNDLSFRWDRQEVGDIGTLWLETKNSQHWAMKAESWSEQEPTVTFNESIMLEGPPVQGQETAPWEGSARMHYWDGLRFYREVPEGQSGYGDSQIEEANYDGAGLTMNQSIWAANAVLLREEATQMEGGRIKMTSKFPEFYPENELNLSATSLTFIQYRDDNTTSSTMLDGAGLSTAAVVAKNVEADDVIAHRVVADDYVLTPKWRVSSQIPDYVFEKGYRPKSLPEVEKFVREKKHLPEIPSAREMSEGVALGDLNLRILKTVEELTLHVIELDKELKAQKVRSAELEKKLKLAERSGR
jgi:hypothetical protein